MSIGTFRRWLYRGQKQNWLARLLNRGTAAMAASGIGADSGLVTLEVAGRTSGRIVSLPVVVVDVEGQRYLVSMLGDHVQWVRNVRAAGGTAIIHSRSREEVHLEEVPSEERAPIVKAYLRRAPGARSHFPVNQDAPLSDFEQIAGTYPVFRIAAPVRTTVAPSSEVKQA